MLVGLWLAPACRHDEPATLPSSKAAPVAATASKDVLAYLPIDSEVVIGIDVKGLRGSALWAQYRPLLVQRLGAQLADITQKCGFDPIEAVESIAFAIADPSDQQSNAVLVVRGLDREHTLACLAKQIIPDTTATIDDGIVVLAHPNNDRRQVLTFVDHSTLIVQAAKQPTKDTLRGLVASGVPLRGSPAFMAMYDQLDRPATVWGAINGRARMLGQIASLGGQPRGLYGTLLVTDGLASTVRLQLETADQATQVTAKLQPQLAVAGAMLGELAVRAEGSVVKLTIAMSADQLRGILATMGLAGGNASP
jgi:hypothetical protein